MNSLLRSKDFKFHLIFRKNSVQALTDQCKFQIHEPVQTFLPFLVGVQKNLSRNVPQAPVSTDPTIQVAT